MSLNKCDVVGESFPSHLCAVSRPAKRFWVGLKSEAGEAEEMK